MWLSVWFKCDGLADAIQSINKKELNIQFPKIRQQDRPILRLDTDSSMKGCGRFSGENEGSCAA
jgi:hypothetical protein